jgi:TRAP-type C4-dicarboxylate transport system substrate-binding protein
VVSLTGHLIIPEIIVFSKRTWEALPKADQDMLRRFAREAQLEERALWDDKTSKAADELKAKGVRFVPADKAAFYKATQPIRDKYGAKYGALVKRIEDTK